MAHGENEDYTFEDIQDQCIVINKITGKIDRWNGNRKRAVGPFKDALKYLKGNIGMEDRLLIVQLSCVGGIKKKKKEKDDASRV